MNLFLILALATTLNARGDRDCDARLGPGHQRIYLVVKAPLTYVDRKPHVVVYRGLRDFYRENPERSVFGRWMYTTLDAEVALDCLGRGPIFRTAERVALLRMRLPLNLAHVAQRETSWVPDTYRPVEELSFFDWLFWGTPKRRRERELVWNLDELGDLTDPKYDLRVIERELPKVDAMEIARGWQNLLTAQTQIRAAAAEDDWRLLSRNLPTTDPL